MGWYEAMAKGGVGLIIYETTSIEHPRGNHRPPTPPIWMMINIFPATVSWSGGYINMAVRSLSS